MGCGCNKTKTLQQPPTDTSTTSKTAMFDVYDAGGTLIASYSNPVTARAEARRSLGTVVPSTSDSTTDNTQTPVTASAASVE